MVVLSSRLAGMLVILSIAPAALALPAGEHSNRDYELNHDISIPPAGSKTAQGPLRKSQLLMSRGHERGPKGESKKQPKKQAAPMLSLPNSHSSQGSQDIVKGKHVAGQHHRDQRPSNDRSDTQSSDIKKRIAVEEPRRRHHDEDIVVIGGGRYRKHYPNVFYGDRGDHVHIHVGRTVNLDENLQARHRHHHGHDDHEHVHIHAREPSHDRDRVHEYIYGGDYHGYDDIDIDAHIRRGPSSNPLEGRSSSTDGVAGIVSLVGTAEDGTTKTAFASMLLTPVTDGTTSGAPFVLNASDTNSTTVYLMGDPDFAPPAGQNGTSTDEEKNVWVTFPIYNPGKLAVEKYCATFDPNPPEPAPMLVDACSPGLQDAHRSQRFAYSPSSGVLRPVYFVNANATGNSTMAKRCDGNCTATATPQNVTMIFTPNEQSLPTEQLLTTFLPSGANDTTSGSPPNGTAQPSDMSDSAATDSVSSNADSIQTSGTLSTSSSSANATPSLTDAAMSNTDPSQSATSESSPSSSDLSATDTSEVSSTTASSPTESASVTPSPTVTPSLANFEWMYSASASSV